MKKRILFFSTIAGSNHLLATNTGAGFFNGISNTTLGRVWSISSSAITTVCFTSGTMDLLPCGIFYSAYFSKTITTDKANSNIIFTLNNE